MSIRLEEHLRFENAFQHVLINLASRLINHPVDQMDQAITEALRQIVEFLGTVRASINLFTEDRVHFTKVYEWAPSDTAYYFPERVPLPDWAVFYPMLERGEALILGNPDDLPTDSQLRRLMVEARLSGTLVVPILHKGGLIGFVSTSWRQPRDLAPEIVDLLRIVGEIFLNALERRENENRIRRLNDELEERIHARTAELRRANERLQQEINERQQVEAALRTSEERYRFVTELISDYAFLYRVEPDKSLKLEWITADSYTRLTGYAVGEIGETFRLYTPEDEARARLDTARTIDGSPTEGEYGIITKSGEKRWLYIRRYPLWDAARQRVERYYGVAQDVTRRRQIEDSLHQKDLMFRATFEQAAVGIAHITPDGRWLHVNHRLCEILGYSAEEFLSGTVQALTFPDDLSADLEHMQRLLVGETRTYALRKRFLQASGETIWTNVTASLVQDSTGGQDYFVFVIEDITALKAAETALTQSEERYRAVTELISDFAFLYRREPDGTLAPEWITENPYIRLTGYTSSEAGAPFNLYHPDDLARAQQDVERTLQGRPTEGEYRIITRSNEERWVYMRRYPIRDEQHNRVDRFYGVVQDITRRKQIEADEHEQRALVEALLDTAHALNSTLTLDEVLARILANLKRVVPHDVSAVLLIEGDMARIVHVTEALRLGRTDVLENLRFALATTENLRWTYETGDPLIIPDTTAYPGWDVIPGTEWIRSHICIPIHQGQDIIGFLTCDSAQPNFFTVKMLKSLRAFAHQIALAIVDARLYQQEKELAVLQERQRLARDLHDAVTQTMFSASVIAETLPRLWERDPEQVRRGLAQLRTLTRGAVAEMRALLLELRPEAQAGLTLAHLITQLVDGFSGQTGIVPRLVIEGERELPQHVKMTLYRIAQEAMNNISKHARASEITVSLTINHMVELIIADNGRGFVPDQVKATSLGLKIMRERAGEIGALLAVESQPGQKTTVTVRWEG